MPAWASANAHLRCHRGSLQLQHHWSTPPALHTAKPRRLQRLRGLQQAPLNVIPTQHRRRMTGPLERRASQALPYQMSSLGPVTTPSSSLISMMLTTEAGSQSPGSGRGRCLRPSRNCGMPGGSVHVGKPMLTETYVHTPRCVWQMLCCQLSTRPVTANAGLWLRHTLRGSNRTGTGAGQLPANAQLAEQSLKSVGVQQLLLNVHPMLTLAGRTASSTAPSASLSCTELSQI